jgi:hypothetical protein
MNILAACFGYALLNGQTPHVSVDTVSNYKQWGWKAVVMKNDLITLATVPAIGGRVMQYDLDSLPSVFVNSAEGGKTYTPALDGQWHNFGGYKTWPAPQSRWNSGGWPPPPKLDYGNYSYQIDSLSSDSADVFVSSPTETWYAPNIRFERKATAYTGTSRIKMDQTIINEGTTAVSWSVWSVTQSIVNHPSKTDYPNYWVYFPINPNSLYGQSGVKPGGNSKAWKGEVAPGVYGVQFSPDNQKLFGDPDKGWIAYTDLADTIVFLRTFDIFEGAQYPDNGARVAAYVSSSPTYVEVEVTSPIIELAANGGKYTFTENWWVAKVRAPILDVNSVGVVAGRLSYNPTTQSLSAFYGVFHKGTATVVFVDANGQTLAEGEPHTVTPLEEFRLQETVAMPNGAKKVEVRVHNTKGELLGVLDGADVSQLLSSVEPKVPTLASEYRLAFNYPNPFNPSTTIAYTLPHKSSVEVIIYDLEGREIRSFIFAAQPEGDQKVVWDGTNDHGSPLSSGIYIVRVRASSLEDGTAFDKSVKMILLK